MLTVTLPVDPPEELRVAAEAFVYYTTLYDSTLYYCYRYRYYYYCYYY